MECQQCVSLCCSCNTKKITSGKRDHGCGGLQINYKVGKSINCEKGMLICHTGEVSLHTLSLHFLPTLPLTPPSIFMHSPTQFYPLLLAQLSLHSLGFSSLHSHTLRCFPNLSFSTLSPLTHSPLLHSTLSPLTLLSPFTFPTLTLHSLTLLSP